MISRPVLYLGAAAVGGLALYLLSKNAGKLASGLVGAVGDAGVGVVKGIGKVVGIPDTNMTQCESDIRNGRTWASSFSCPASTFVGGVFNSTTFNDAEIRDARQIDRIIERQQAAVGGLSGVYDPATGAEVGRYDEMGNRIY